MKMINSKTLLLCMSFFVAFAGKSFAQSGGIDLDLASGNQSKVTYEGQVTTGSTYNVEVHAANVSNVVAFEFELSFDATHFSYTAGDRSLKGITSNEANLLTKAGGAIFGGATGGFENITTANGRTTLRLSVTLDAASQTNNAVTGSGLLANVSLKTLAGFNSGTTSSIKLEKVSFVNQSNAAVTGTITNGTGSVKQNFAPTVPANLVPANNAIVKIGGDTKATAVEPATKVTISWGASTDAESNPLTYTWQLCTDATCATTLLEVPNGNKTTIDLTVGQINTLLKTNGVVGGGSKELYHRVKVADGVNAAVLSSTNKVTMQRLFVVANESADVLPDAFKLNGNYPNPFNPSTNITFDLPTAAAVNVQVFDTLGRIVMEMPNQTFGAGFGQSIQLNASGLNSGVYFYRLNAEMATSKMSKVGQMTLVK